MSGSLGSMDTDNSVFDVIFAGGGTTACVAAGRLAAADPTLKILILEAGPHTRDVPEHIQPAVHYRNLTLPNRDIFTFHVGTPSEALLGRPPVAITGRCVGGGSSINFLVYTRAAASDYDDWESQFNNKGWGSKDLIPLLKKAETYQPGSTNATHGTSGPIKVSYASDSINISENFLEVASVIDKGRSFTDDTNDFSECGKYGRWPRYIDAETGRRSDTAHGYIYNQELKSNLKVLDRRRVVRVIFEGDRAVGVEYVDDSVGRTGSLDTPRIARASRLVVLSAGPFGSSAILERSGIGAKSILEKNSVQPLVDLPGVGENYMDHVALFLPFVATEDADTIDEIYRASKEEVERKWPYLLTKQRISNSLPHLSAYVQQWLKDGTGLMAHNGMDSGIKMRPNAEELALMSPEFDHRWKSYFANSPDKPVMLFLPYAGYGRQDLTIPRVKYFCIAYFLMYPACVGRVHITSGSNPYARSDFHAGYLDDTVDLVPMRWAYKKSRELARRMKYFTGELQTGHPKFKEDSQAKTQLSGPVGFDSPDIIYSEEDDYAIDEFHRMTVVTAGHSAGTCAMKPREQQGVVDERLNVYGVLGLKVADCSIMPSNVGANTYNTAIAIGEKAAVIIAEDLGLALSSQAA